MSGEGPEEGLPRLKRLVVLSFKGIGEAGLQLGPFEVLIGRNGSGKSSVIEALQWVEEALRSSASQATERHRRMSDLLNKGATLGSSFGVATDFELDGAPRSRWQYVLQAGDLADRYPRILHELLLRIQGDQGESWSLFDSRLEALEPSREVKHRGQARPPSDHLGLSRGGLVPPLDPGQPESAEQAAARQILAWWRRAVFLRLHPAAQVQDSRGYRLSSEPMLDEAGARLPALLEELDEERREALVAAIADILPDYEGLKLSAPDLDARVHYSLVQRMRGPRGGRGRAWPIPAWMLSEGTRRITAILALLHHPTPPSLLCIEEVENGLDPWTVQALLRHLRAAAEGGVQVLLTTHSPWLLDHVPMECIIQVRKERGQAVYHRFQDRPEVAAYDPSVPAGTRYVNEL